MVNPHSVETKRRKCPEMNSLEIIDVHNAKSACRKKKGKTTQQKCKGRVMKFIVKKSIEIKGKTAKKYHDTKEQQMADHHHAEIVFKKDNNQKKKNSTYKNIKPEAEEAFGQPAF
jgi:hypothetical protein